jgi:sugar lactone lactonase YvrE
VIVGSLPTNDGTAATAKAGCLIVLNSKGKAVETISGNGINGPWDMTLVDGGSSATLFVTNVLNGTVAASPKVVYKGTVLRINLSIPDGDKPRVMSRKVIGSGFQERTDPAALVIGPTGLGLGSDGTLYVADTLPNRIVAIPHALTRNSDAGTGKTVSSNGALNGPLGLTIAPNGNILAANAADGNLVEITPAGVQIATKTIEPGGAGTLFGLAIVPQGRGVYFVDDGTNQLGLLSK